MKKNKKVKIPVGLSRDVGVMIEHFDEKLDFVMENLIDVKQDVNVIKMDIEQIKHDLKNKIDRNEFAILERRVALLEIRR